MTVDKTPDYANDGTEWSEIDLLDLRACAASGDTLVEAAWHLGRSGTVDTVAAKAKELGLTFRRS